MTLLKHNLPLHNSKILPLQPFIRNKLLHVGGRLKYSFLPEESKHPIILPKDHHVTKLIAEFIYKSNHHCGRDHLASSTREKYWIASCKSVCREVVKHLKHDEQCLTHHLPTQELIILAQLPLKGENGPEQAQEQSMVKEKVWCRFYMPNV